MCVNILSYHIHFFFSLQRLESELNTLMDLHQHGVTELKEQLTQLERVTFSKNQDLEDTVENCQSRVNSIEKYTCTCTYFTLLFGLYMYL